MIEKDARKTMPQPDETLDVLITQMTNQEARKTVPVPSYSRGSDRHEKSTVKIHPPKFDHHKIELKEMQTPKLEIKKEPSVDIKSLHHHGRLNADDDGETLSREDGLYIAVRREKHIKIECHEDAPDSDDPSGVIEG